jgi:ribosome biogenesis GTPase / thiamine phosphate phosphatase
MQKTSNQVMSPLEQTGLIIAYHGNSVAVELNDGQVFPCKLRRNQTLPVVGDEVLCQIGEDQTVKVSAILPRRSLLVRGGGKGGAVKPIAANIDRLIIVMAPQGFSQVLLDRYLIAAELLSIHPLIIMNKIDLISEIEESVLWQTLNAYENLPYDILRVSAHSGVGMQNLSAYLHAKTAVFVGPSGVGKSSLISLLAEEAVRTRAVSPKGTGKHTTTDTRLYHLPHGGQVIDSPGVRDFSLWPVSRQEVIKGFKELKPYLQACRFRDCLHVAEPGCLVKEAVLRGEISVSRYEAYQALIKESHR